RSGSPRSAWITGASLIASGRVPSTTRIFLRASASTALPLHHGADRRRYPRPEAPRRPDLLPVVAEPANRPLQGVLEAGGGFVADQLARPVDGGQQPVLGVPPPLGDQLDARPVAHGAVDHLGEHADADLALGREIDRLAHGGVVEA